MNANRPKTKLEDVNCSCGIFPLLLLLASCLCTACEEPYEVDLKVPEDAIVFDGVITDEAPPYYFLLSKPSASLKKDKTFDYERIDDAEIVIVDLTDDVRDTLEVAQVTPYKDLQYYDHYRDKKVTCYMQWRDNQKPGGLYVTTKIHGIENHVYELHIKYNGKEYVACERMVPKTPIDNITMKPIAIGEGEYNELPVSASGILRRNITIICIPSSLFLPNPFASHPSKACIGEGPETQAAGRMPSWTTATWASMSTIMN